MSVLFERFLVVPLFIAFDHWCPTIKGPLGKKPGHIPQLSNFGDMKTLMKLLERA